MGKRSPKEVIIFNGVALTPRELDVLRWMAEEGLIAKQIALRLNLSVGTIEKMLGTTDRYYSIYNKIGVENRDDAIKWYLDGKHQMEMKVQEERLIDRILQDRNQLMKDLSAAVEVRRKEISEPRKPPVKKPDPPATRLLKAIREP